LANPVTAVPEARPLLDEAAVRELSQRLGENEALLERRLEALRVFADTALPDRVQHLWRYSDPSRLLPSAILGAAGPAAAAEVPELPEGGAVILLRAGAPPLVRLSDAAEKMGLRVAALELDGDAADRLGTTVPAAHGFFEALNGAAWSAGLSLEVPPKARLEGPIRIVVPAAAGSSIPRLLVRIGELAEATVVEEHAGGTEESYVTSVTEIEAGPGAHVRHMLLQSWGAGVAGHLTTRARLDRDADLATIVVSFGGSRVKMDLGAVLDGPGARSELVGFVLGHDRQHMDHHTVHSHRSGRTWSNIDFKVALTGYARSAYTGVIRIDEEAGATEAYQENRNLLLSETCRADTIPELEILTDDVQCTHGATVAPLDEEMVFYLESRGIPREQAERLIVRGFLEKTLSRVPEAVRPQVVEVVEERLSHFLGGHR